MFYVVSESTIRSRNGKLNCSIAYNRVAMTVKELRELLDPEDDQLEVLVRPRIPDFDVVPPEFRIAGVTRTLERDTAETVVVLECDQEE